MLDYETLYKKAYKDNVKNTPQAARRGELDDKINNFCQLHGFEKEYILEQITTNDVVAACFSKNPNKQNFYEEIAADFIKEINGVTDFEKLPTNNLFVVSGGVMTKEELRRHGVSAVAKTIDFCWKYGDVQFYASHKYTKQEGGSQGNQYKDLQAFISAARGTNKENTCFVAIADGEFYLGKDGQSGKPRIRRLKDLVTENVFACTICELEKLMIDIIDQKRGIC